jgi:DNA-binding NarL/FixJ family response regulator
MPESVKAAPVEAPTEAQSTAAEEARRYTSRPSAANPATNRYQRVYELSDQGLSREQIARESGILPGEVDLILNLRPGKRR